ncbi:MAG: type II secretion system protein [Phycisphaerae bacterium]|nr:type II secretion system protein [Phycisphaerae bacterium]
MKDGHSNRAVTLIEMMVVLGIIVVLAGVVVTLTLRADSQSKERALDNAFALLGTSLREYYEFRDEFPKQTERIDWQAVTANDYKTYLARVVTHIESMVQALRSVPDSRHVLDQLSPASLKSQEGLADVPELRDPWGTVLDYIYDPSAGDTFPELISAGEDKLFGTDDDISNKGIQKN